MCALCWDDVGCNKKFTQAGSFYFYVAKWSDTELVGMSEQSDMKLVRQRPHSITFN